MRHPIQFKPSSEPTIGVEVELQVVDAGSGDLVPGVPTLLEALPHSEAAFFKPELYQSCLEINTPVCRDMDHVERVLREKLCQGLTMAAGHGLGLIGAGTHPFAEAKAQKLTPSKRYEELVNALQWTACQFNVFGLHIHVGVDSGEKAIALLNQSVLYLPQLLALSSSSPFWEGNDTGLQSMRSKIFEGLSIAGIPHFFNSWEDYSRLVNHLIVTESILTFREIWWDVRPHPDFGTLEWRICDCPSTFDEMLCLVALMYTLVFKLSCDFDRGLIHRRPHASIIKENKWRATRYGIHGKMIDPVTYKSIEMKRAISDLVSELEDYASELGTGSWLKRIISMVESGTSADRQRESFERSGNLNAVVESLREDLAAPLGVTAET